MSPSNHVWTEPAPGVAPKPRTYTPEQQAMINELREYAKTIMLPESDPYYEHERHWLLDDPECCGRYMRAAKWKLDDGKKRLQGTLAWRREYKPDLIPPEEVRIESETGKIILNGFDRDGRPILYMRPGRENTETSPRQIRHLIFCLERAIDFMPPNQDSMVIIVDYKSTTLRTNPSIGVARKVLGILQQHYVERLGRAIVVNLPGILNFFYKGISPFLDPVTRDKMRFNPDLLELIPPSQLDADIGGEFKYKFEPISYWEQVISHCRLNPDGSHIRETHVSNTDKGPDPEGIEGNSPTGTSPDDNGPNEPIVAGLSSSSGSRASTIVDEALPPTAEKAEQVQIENANTQPIAS